MKKVISVILLVLVLGLTGCGKSKIVCTSNEADSAFEANAKTTFVFGSNNKLKEIDFSGKLLDNDTSETLLKLMTAMGYIYDVKNDSGNITGKMNIEKYKEEYNLTDSELTKAKIKEVMNNNSSFTCK